MARLRSILLRTVGALAVLALAGLTLVFIYAEDIICSDLVAKTDAPQPPRHVLFSPEFHSKGQVLRAGHGFLSRADGRRLFVSAHHLIGTSGGFDRDYEWNEIPAAVDRIVARSVNDPARAFTAMEPLLIEGATGLNDETFALDLMAFKVVGDPKGNASAGLQWAKRQPEIGERVWLFSPVSGSDKLLHQACVLDIEDSGIAYMFDDPIKLQATSGAPVLNSDGDVLAMNLGGVVEGGRTIGFGNPAHAMLAHLTRALKGGQ